MTPRTSNDGLEGVEAQEQLVSRLKGAREYLGLSQEFVAKQTGISRVAISAIENGKRKVEAVELGALASLYKYPLAYFLDGTVDEPASVRAIARAATELVDQDRLQVLNFAQFLKAYGGNKGVTAVRSDLDDVKG